MASGFIILEDGRAWAKAGWLYDAVLGELIGSIHLGSDEEPFRKFLEDHRPKEGDIDIGYGFIRRGSDENVLRELDLRTLSPKARSVFWAAVERAMVHCQGEDSEPIRSGLTHLHAMGRSISNGEPPEALTDVTKPMDLPEPGLQEGPWWDDR